MPIDGEPLAQQHIFGQDNETDPFRMWANQSIPERESVDEVCYHIKKPEQLARLKRFFADDIEDGVVSVAKREDGVGYDLTVDTSSDRGKAIKSRIDQSVQNVSEPTENTEHKAA